MQSAQIATHPRSSERDKRTLDQLNADYIRSVATSDVTWFAEHLSENFLNSNPDGSLVDRPGFLAQIAKPVTLTNLKCDNVRIRLFGSMAIIHARTTYDKPDGQPATGRYTNVWSLENDRWVCIAAHVTRG